MIKNPKIELLSPAKNLEVGIAAINHGADAVYIGPSQFGARVAAGNSIEDIAKLVDYAHKYYARVYVTLNTILKDEELEQARLLVNDLYNIGVDALIVQDMALLQMDLPPIALHASTQCDTRTVEKVKFLEQCGFEQVVLARETSLATMRQMSEQTNVALEAFVHGALCVSYSGQCYLSEAMRGRSANRGACAQMCRLPYDLLDEDGNTLLHKKHLLSLKDFDASHHLHEMIDAGISSFKIEGRLKDINYVKNITSYYRRKFDAILEGSPRKAASSGKTTLFFEPNPKKTFYRGATDYFLEGRKRDIWSFDTPKSLGEPIGKVKDIWRNAISMHNSQFTIHNGDGLCFLNKKGEFEGFRVNKVESGRLLPLQMPKIEKGTLVYRNSDVAFERILAGKTAERKIGLHIKVETQYIASQSQQHLCLSITDIDNISTSFETEVSGELANNPDKMLDTWRTQLSKLGGTIFEASQIDLSALDKPYFVPVSQIAEWRRQLVELHEINRSKAYKRSLIEIKPTTHKYVATELDYRANIYNSQAKAFYEQHGCIVNQPAFEQQHQSNAELMRTKHCIRYALGWCKKNSQCIMHNAQLKETKDMKHAVLYLQNGNDRFRLEFDCRNCEMIIKQG
ncbi:MAG: U32 family peptidase [Paludibacteraceae bacterium]|nr:U32 family peptidase [Paludibacteraceae bacterium]